MYMKRIFYITIVSILSVSVNAQDAGEIAKFEQEVISLGKVVKGDMVKNKFVFTNISSEDIEIDIVSTCDCTKAKWTSGPIAPGKVGSVDFTFDSSKKDEVVPIDVDIYFLNINPKTGNPYSMYLQYTFFY